MDWKSGLALLTLPAILDLYERWATYRKPFDGSWRYVHVIQLILGHEPREQRDASGPEIGGHSLRALPPPLAEHEAAEGGAVEQPASDRATP